MVTLGRQRAGKGERRRRSVVLRSHPSELMCRLTNLHHPDHKRVNAAEVGILAELVEGDAERVVLVQRLRLELLLLGGDGMGFIIVVDPDHRRSHRHRHLGRHELEVLYGHLYCTCVSAEAKRRRDEEDEPHRARETPGGEPASGIMLLRIDLSWSRKYAPRRSAFSIMPSSTRT